MFNFNKEYQVIQIPDQYLLIVSGKPVVGEHFVLRSVGTKKLRELGEYPKYSLNKHDDSTVSRFKAICEGSLRVIAHLPLNDSPILTGVDLLPSISNFDNLPNKFIPETIKHRCNCECHHSNAMVMHFMACCDNGYVNTGIVSKIENEGNPIWKGSWSNETN